MIRFQTEKNNPVMKRLAIIYSLNICKFLLFKQKGASFNFTMILGTIPNAMLLRHVCTAQQQRVLLAESCNITKFS